MVEIVEGAFKDALPVLRSRLNVYIVLGVLAVIAGAAVAFLMPDIPMKDAHGADITMPGMALDLRTMLGLDAVQFFMAIAVFFALPAVIRTVRPEFGMTVGRFFGILGLGIVVGLAVGLGTICLLIPGIWIAVKWSQTIWCYLLSDGKNPLGESWEITTGKFWETFGFLILVSIVVAAITMVPLYVSMMTGRFGIVLYPIVFAAYLYAIHFQCLAELRWMLYLRQRSTVPAAVVPA